VQPSPRLLLIEDDPGAAASLRRLLAAEGYQVEIQPDGTDGLAAARAGNHDVVLTDWRLPGTSGLDIIRELHRSHPRLPIILITAHGSTETAIEATKHGAFEYLLKPLDMEELLAVTARAVATRRLMAEPVGLGEGGPAQDSLVGQSRAMRDIYKEIGRVAAQPVDVLIRGETGSGKELVARALYQHSHRAQAPFIAVNCAAIPESLLESELFGHERGAFTGAVTRRIGRFEQADGGTVFLDEIGDLSLPTQAKLLRVLQERVLSRVGGNELIPVDVRILAATHRDLEEMIRERLFREDLFYRLSQFTIALPALRQRPEDIPDLARHLGLRFAHELGVGHPAFTPEALQLLQAQPWPGNVRQLANFIRQLLILSHGHVGADHVRITLAKSDRPGTPDASSALDTLALHFLTQARETGSDDAHARLVAEAERVLLHAAMEQAGGNKTQAAKWLGITRFTLRERLSQLGLKEAS
jgi:DNA-binding NtrC family response regulator